MKISIRTLSDDKISLTLSNYKVNPERLNSATKRITHHCYVSMQKAINKLIIVLERKTPNSDLHITAGKLLAELRPQPA